MIYISQGHERGIGLEIFLRSIISLPQKLQKEFTLVCNKNTLKETLESLSLPYLVNPQTFEILGSTYQSIFLTPKENQTQSTQCLEEATILAEQNNSILITLPTSKDQIIKNNKQFNGHTDYFRDRYDAKKITMSFISDEFKLLLLSEHIPIQLICSHLRESDLQDRIANNIQQATRLYPELTNISFAGINPHAGENGLIGDEDSLITELIEVLREKFPTLSFSGPFPADTIFLNPNLPKKKTLFIYSYHDQALPLFKGLNGFLGLNLTLGLPFIRLSPDHGTAFALYGTKTANINSTTNLLLEAIKIKKRAHQR